MAASACRLQTISESASVDIQYCPDCELLHLTMGSITIRMTEQHFSQFAQDISKGLFEFHAVTSGQPGIRMMM